MFTLFDPEISWGDRAFGVSSCFSGSLSAFTSTGRGAGLAGGKVGGTVVVKTASNVKRRMTGKLLLRK